MQMMVLDGNAYDAKLLGEAGWRVAGRPGDADFLSYALLQNNKATPLLVAGNGENDEAGRVVFDAVVGAQEAPGDGGGEAHGCSWGVRV